MDRAPAEDWIHACVKPAGPIQAVHDRPWSTVLRIPLAGGGAWFKACGPVQGFEPGLTAALFARWPDRIAEVLAWDQDRSWLLLRDAGTPMAALGNPPEAWLALLPRYAELQRGEVTHVDDHLQGGVPDLGVARLPGCYEQLHEADLPLGEAEKVQLRRFAGRFEQLCGELAHAGVPETIQHDDLHPHNVFARNGTMRVLDWGDSSISHPFASLVATFRFLEVRNGLAPHDRWFRRLRDAYLEPWGPGLAQTFMLATQVGAFAHAIACLRQRRALSGRARARFDVDVVTRLRRALAIVNSPAAAAGG